MVERTVKTHSKRESILVGRKDERGKILKALTQTMDGAGSMILLKGEAGVGKTYLLENLSKEAEANGFNVLWGKFLDYRKSPHLPFKDMLIDHFNITSNDSYMEKIKKVRNHLKGSIILEKDFQDGFIDMVVPKDEPVGGFKLEGKYMDQLLDYLLNEGYRILIIKGEEEEEYEMKPGMDIIRIGSQRSDSIPPRRLERVASHIKGSISRYRHCAIVNDSTSILLDENPKAKIENLIKIANGMAKENGALSIHIDRGGIDDLFSKLNEIKPVILDNAKNGNENSEVSTKLGINDLFSTYIKETSKDQPILIVLEDMQWGDISSFNLLQYLARDANNERYCIIGSYRSIDFELEENGLKLAPLKDALQRISRERLFNTISLERFNKEEQRELIEILEGASINEDAFKEITEGTEGNPKFIKDQLEKYRSKDPKVISNRTGMDSNEDSSFLRKILGLDDIARSMVEFASILKNYSKLEIIVKGLGIDEEDSLDRLDELLELKILTEVDEVLTFDHPKTRGSVYANIPIEKRKKLHRKAAECIESSHSSMNDEVTLKELAEHYYNGGDMDKAFRTYSQVAQIEIERRNDRDALIDLEKVLFCLGQLPTSKENDKHRVQTLQLIGDIKESSGDTKGALISFKEAIEIAEKRSVPFGLSSSYRRIGDIMLKLFEWDQTVDYYLRSLHISKKENDQDEIAKAFRGLGIIYYLKGDYSRSMDCYLKYMDFPKKETKNHDVLALLEVGCIYYEMGDLNQALTYYKLAIKKGEECDLNNESALAYVNMANVLMRLGEVDDARRYSNWGFNKIKDHLENEISQKVALTYIELMLDSADIDKAEEVVEHLAKIPERELGDRLLRGLRHRILGQFYAKKRDFPVSRKKMDRALEVHRSLQVPFQLGLTCYNYGLILFQQMKVDEAMDMLKEASKQFKSINAIYFQNRTSSKIRELTFIKEGLRS